MAAASELGTLLNAQTNPVCKSVLPEQQPQHLQILEKVFFRFLGRNMRKSVIVPF